MRHWGLGTCQLSREVQLRRQSQALVSFLDHRPPCWSLGQGIGNTSSLGLVASADQIITMGHTNCCVPSHSLPGERPELSILHLLDSQGGPQTGGYGDLQPAPYFSGEGLMIG